MALARNGCPKWEVARCDRRQKRPEVKQLTSDRPCAADSAITKVSDADVFCAALDLGHVGVG
eukprot:5061905-Prymnesium_polylepis.1